MNAQPTDVATALRAAAVEVREAVAAARPVPPGTARHRGHGPGPARRPRPLLAAAAVAAAVTAVVLGLTTYLGGGGVRTAPPAAPSGPAPSSSPAGPSPSAASTTSAQAPVCGDRVPVGIYPPKGWKGPLAGPADGSTAAAEPGQLVVHWAGPGGSVEIRWPSSTSGPAPYDPMESMSTTQDGDARLLMLPVAGGDPPCTHLVARWSGTAPKGYGSGVNGFTEPVDRALVALVTAPKDLELVSRTRQVTTAPTAPVPCDAADQPVRKGTGGGAAQPTPEQALQAFLDGDGRAAGGFNRSGWTKFVLPGGGVAFGVPFEGGPGWVQLVTVTDTGDGWVVARWTTSGC